MSWMLEIPIQRAAAKCGSSFITLTALSGATCVIPANAIRVRVDPDRAGTYLAMPLGGISDERGCVVTVRQETEKRQWERKLKRIMVLSRGAARIPKRRPAVAIPLDVSLRIE